MDYPVITIEAKELCETDWVEGEGPVSEVAHYSTLTHVRFPRDSKLLASKSRVDVRLEDHGQTE